MAPAGCLWQAGAQRGVSQRARRWRSPDRHTKQRQARVNVSRRPRTRAGPVHAGAHRSATSSPSASCTPPARGWERPSVSVLMGREPARRGRTACGRSRATAWSTRSRTPVTALSGLDPRGESSNGIGSEPAKRSSGPSGDSAVTWRLSVTSTSGSGPNQLRDRIGAAHAGPCRHGAGRGPSLDRFDALNTKNLSPASERAEP
jgi:hypothetical protein